MAESIITVSHDFFGELVRPVLERECPEITAQMVFGIFGHGSEAFRMDDQFSQDHHWGLRINALVPEAIYADSHTAIAKAVDANLPNSYRGHALQEGYSGKGLNLESLEGFLRRTVGLDHAPVTYAEWLAMPEEDIFHVINGEIWYDPSGAFSSLRNAFNAYYPEPVRLRRIAHFCRYFSGMGAYALNRAILRNNDFYATIVFARAIRLGVQLAFLLDRQYYPYDKWLFAFFQRLPRMADRLCRPVEEAVLLSTRWERKLELLNHIADVIDATMMEDGIIPPHPKFQGSASSGYRLLEHGYAEIIKTLPEQVRSMVPVVDQIYFEQHHVDYVSHIDMQTWDSLLNLKPID